MVLRRSRDGGVDHRSFLGGQGAQRRSLLRQARRRRAVGSVGDHLVDEGFISGSGTYGRYVFAMSVIRSPAHKRLLGHAPSWRSTDGEGERRPDPEADVDHDAGWPAETHSAKRSIHDGLAALLAATAWSQA